MPEKFVVVKAVEGWADRLQTVTGAISYALRHKRTLIIDFNDPVWGGDFSAYFLLVDVVWCRTLPPELARETNVFPKYWAGQLDKPGGAWTYDVKAQVETTYADLERTARPERVIVLTNIGWRAYDALTMAARMRATHWLVRAWAARRARLPLRYHAVHLRGSDRAASAEARAALRDRVTALLTRASAGETKLPIVVITDDPSLHEQWAAVRPRDLCLWPVSRTAAARCDASTGTHKAGPSELTARGWSKRQLNMELLLDWFTLVDALTAWTTHVGDANGSNKSLFYDMARSLARNKTAVRRIMGHAIQPPPAPTLPCAAGADTVGEEEEAEGQRR